MVLAGPLTAAWVLVDDFQDGNVDDWLFDTVNFSSEAALAAVPEPFLNGDSANYVLEMDPGITLSEGASTSANTTRVRAAKTMPGIDNLGTVYVRMAQPRGEGGIFSILNNIWGAAPAALDAIPNFNDFSALMRIEHTVHNFDVYDGTINPDTGKARGYQNVATELAMETWYEIWITIDHINSAFAVYVRGGPEFPQITKAYPSGDGMAGYRNLTFDPLERFMIITTVGVVSDVKSKDNFYVDDIYVDTTGYNLTSPVAAGYGKWGPWDIIDADGNVNTGGWMGYINVALDPYIWSYSLSSWAYVDSATITNGGSWVYVFN